jgi:tetratricopeptide (TPR) repeat protein
MMMQNLFRALKQKTPQNSKRVLILEALQLEYHSKLKEALQIYSSVDETNSFVQKRIVTISHELNKEEGIRKLISYLNSHPLDTEAWLRLFYYYKEIGMIDEAVHCLDELLLLRPLNYEYFELYAEFLLQNYQKSKDHNVLARKMLLKSLELTGFKHGKARQGVLEKISQCNAVINDGHSEQLEILLKKL